MKVIFHCRILDYLVLSKDCPSRTLSTYINTLVWMLVVIDA
jgi:hypothetical protein